MEHIDGPVNPAARLHAALEKAVGVSRRYRGRPTLDAWRHVLAEEHPEDAPDVVIVVGQRLMSLLADVSRLRELVPQHTRIRPERYEAHLESIAWTLLPTHFPIAWESVVGRIGTDLLATLGVLADSLPVLEQAIEDRSIASVLDLVSEVEREVLDDSSLGNELRQFILRALGAVRAATQEYPFRGVAALRDAYNMLLVGLAHFGPAVQTSSRPVAVDRFLLVAAALVSLVNDAGTFVDNAGKLIGAAKVVEAKVPEAARRLHLPGAHAPRLLTAGEPSPPDATSAAPTPHD
jgi:hypothetical protein